jgi:hypothetical protein
VITANIHGVKAVRLVRIEYGDFVEHKFVFETGDGDVVISGFAPAAMDVEILPTRSTLIDSTGAAS